MKLLLRFIAPVDSSVIAPAVVMLPVVEANVMSPEDVMVLVLIASPVVPDKVDVPCPVMVPPLCPMVSFPARFNEVPDARVMLPLIRLRSPVIRASSVLLIFIPENPEVNPNPKLPLFDTLMVVALVPVFIDPVKLKSLAVTVKALLVVDKAPEMVVVPVPEFRSTVPFAERPARETPELAVRFAVVTEVSALPTVILPVEFRVSEPLLAVIVDPPKVIFPPEMLVPLARESELPPSRLMFSAAVSVLLPRVRPLLAVIVIAP